MRPTFVPLCAATLFAVSTVVSAQSQDCAALAAQVAPGIVHCAGGAATDSWDGLGALVDWVETGRAPQTIIASGTSVFPGRTRPLCPYPQYAHYAGSGNPEDAVNFTCRQP